MNFIEILTALEPFLLEAIIAVGVAVAMRLTGGRIAQDTLHRAIETGVYGIKDALDDGRITREEAVDLVMSYVSRSSPGAVKTLKAPEGVVRDLIKAKISAQAPKR